MQRLSWGFAGAEGRVGSLCSLRSLAVCGYDTMFVAPCCPECFWNTNALVMWGGQHRATSMLPPTKHFIGGIFCPWPCPAELWGLCLVQGWGQDGGFPRAQQARWSWARSRCCQAQLYVLRWKWSCGMRCELLYRELFQAAGAWGGQDSCSQGSRGSNLSQLSTFTTSTKVPRVGLFSVGCSSSLLSKPQTLEGETRE